MSDQGNGIRVRVHAELLTDDATVPAALVITVGCPSHQRSADLYPGDTFTCPDCRTTVHAVRPGENGPVASESTG